MYMSQIFVMERLCTVMLHDRSMRDHWCSCVLFTIELFDRLKCDGKCDIIVKFSKRENMEKMMNSCMSLGAL